jgi:hypothetical protein
MTQNAAHASILKIAGTEYRVRRTFDLICSVEEAFGEIGAFILSADKERLKAPDIARLYGLLLAGQPNPPAAGIIQDHIAAVGTQESLRSALNICAMFFVGEERYMKTLWAPALGNGVGPRTGA